MKRNFKRMSLLLLSGILCVQFMTYQTVTANAEESSNKESNDYTVERVSHPDRGPGEIDGILTGEDEDRGQSYSWAAVDYGDYLYTGTCYNPIFGIFYRNLTSNLKDLFKDKTDSVVKSIISILYNGNFYDNQKSNPAIIKTNKKTGESSVLYRYSDANPTSKNNMSGFRMAAAFNGKLYFVGSGYPTSIVLEIDPVTEKSKEVYTRTVKNYEIASGIHGLVVFNNQLLMSVTEEGSDGTPSAKIYVSKNPSEFQDNISKNWTEIANSSSFKNYPTLMIKDGINGGGVWDLCAYNNELYVTMITDRGEDVKNKKGFAMFKGTQNGQSWTWKEVIGNTKDGAAYPFGLSMSAATTANLFSYGGYLYIGNYNDPMLDLAEVVKGDFKPLYNDLKLSINLYRMDKNGKIELVAGQANASFPNGPIGNLGAGLGNHMNQYVWRMEEYEGKFYVGTFDTSTITNAFTQLTNGEFIENNLMDEASFLKLLGNVSDIISALLKGRSAIDATTSSDLNAMLDDLTGIKQQVKGVQARSAVQKDVVDNYLAFMAKYNVVKKFLPLGVVEEIEKVIPIIEQNVYYYGINAFCKTAEKGFDLLVSEDGINFEAITRTGFGDPNNHGLRTMNATDEGLFLGTANPFWGTQQWKLTNNYDNPTIAPMNVSFFKNEATDYIMNVAFHENALRSIVVEGTTLTKDKDYTVTNNTITIKKEFLNTLSYRDNAYTFHINFNHQKAIDVNVQVLTKPQEETYSVLFDTQGGNSVPPITNIKKDSLITKPEGPIREGYTFEGWFTSLDYQTPWNFDSNKVTNNITLFAKWKANQPVSTFEVRFDSKGGSFVAPVTGLTTGAKIPAVSDPIKLGYKFDGWYIDETYKTAWSFENDAIKDRDVTLYAKWIVENFNITYALNGGTNAEGNPATFTIESPTFTLKDPQKAGYTFGGWYSDAELKNNVSNVITKGSTGNKTLYAKWNVITYKITYNVNGGSLAAGTPTSYMVEHELIIANPTREGYTFAGWYLDAAFTKAVSATISRGTIGDKVWYAKWTKNPDSTPVPTPDPTPDKKPDAGTGDAGNTGGTNTPTPDPTPDRDVTENKPDTADHANQMIYFELLLGAILILGCVVIRNKRQKKA